MKKYTNKILITTGILLLVLTSFLVVREYKIQKKSDNIRTWEEISEMHNIH